MSRGPSTQCLPPAPPLAAAWPRLLPGAAADDSGPSDLREHLARHGARPACAGDWQRRQRLIDEVERAGLTGRGGAAFPAAVKLRTAASSPRAPVVIANGVEGEPASAKDKVLLSCAPHLVIDGAVSAAELVGASEAVIVAHPAACEAVRRAAGERAAAGCDPVPVRVLEAAGPNGRTLASSLNIAAFNLGNALGAWAGGVTIARGLGLSALPLVAAGITAVGLVLALWSLRLDRAQAAVAVCPAE